MKRDRFIQMPSASVERDFTVFGGTGDDWVGGSSLDDTLFGLGGNDTLNANAGNDTLYGGDGNDTLYAGEGDDTLYGGSGGDWMYGGLGNDTYVIGAGDGSSIVGPVSVTNGAELIWENEGEGTDTLLLDSLTQADVTFSSQGTGYFVVGVDDGTGTILYTNIAVFGGDLWARIERIEFGDGSFIDATTGFDYTGTAGADNYLGAGSDDTLVGQAGDDQLYGQGGADLLDGGAGADLMVGGTGDDTYVVRPGDGIAQGNALTDRISESVGEGTDTIRIQGVLPEDLVFLRGLSVNSNAMGIYDATGTLLLTYFTIFPLNATFWDVYERIEFDNGTVWTAATGIVYRGTQGDDFIVGTDGSESILGEGGDDQLQGADGNDTLYGGAGDDSIYGGLGNDTLYSSVGADLMRGNEGDDTYVIDLVQHGGARDDGQITEQQNQGFDTVHFTGVSATDLIISGADYGPGYLSVTNWFYGADVGGSIEWFTITRSGDFWGAIDQIILGDGTIYTAATGLTHYGRDDDDILWASEGGDDLYGGLGEDELRGGVGNDTLIGGMGADSMNGSLGDDVYVVGLGEGSLVVGAETILEGDGGGFDTLRLIGVDVANMAVTYTNWQINLGLGDGAGNYTWVSISAGLDGDWPAFWSRIEQVVFDNGTIWSASNTPDFAGTNLDDTMNAFASGSRLSGLGGDDTLIGAAGDDMLFGGAGDDSITGDAGADTLDGGAGHDTMVGGAGGDTYLIGFGDGTIGTFDERIVEFGGTGTDIIHFTDGLTASDIFIEVGDQEIAFGTDDGTGTMLWTSVFNVSTSGSSTGTGFSALWSVIEELRFDDGTVIDQNTVYTYGGTVQDDVIVGSFLQDDIYGRGGNDQLIGGDGVDYLFGGAGDDVLFDDGGQDVLNGGAGADIFVFTDATDGGRITDFELGVDRIDLSAYYDPRDRLVLSDFDGVLDIVSDPIGNGDQGTLEIRFLQSAGDLSINVSRRNGITDAGAEPVSFQIQIDGGLSLPFTTDLFYF